jgi:glutamine cyclotransferase
MPTDLHEQDFRTFLVRMAGEMAVPDEVPPRAVRRARARLLRTAVAGVLAAILVAVGSVSGVRSLLRADAPRPADRSAEAIVATIPVEGAPVHVAAGEGFVWVAGSSGASEDASSNVSKVDPATNQVVATFPGNPRREGSAIAVGEGAAWVSEARPGGGGLRRIDATSGELTSFGAGDMYRAPYAVAIGGGAAWATNDRSGTLRQVDTAATQGSSVPTIELPRLHAYGVTYLDGTVWVVGADVDGEPADLLAVDPGSGAVVATLSVGVAHEVTSGFGSLWAPSGAADPAEASILRVDPSTGEVIATVSTPFLDSAALLDPDPPRVAVGVGAVWVAVTDRNGATTRGRIMRIDPASNRVVGEIAIETPAAGLAAGAGAVWVTDGLGTLYRIDPDAVVGSDVAPLPVPEPTPTGEPTEGPIAAEIRFGGWGSEMALGEDAVWLINAETGVLVRVDPTNDEVVGTIDFGVSDNPASVAVGGGAVWIASPDDGDGAIFRVDPATNDVVAMLPNESGWWISAGGSGVWVVRGLSLVRIDPATNTEVASVSLGGGVDATAERPVEADGLLWTIVDRATTGDLVGIDPASGEIVRRFEIDDGLMHGIVAGFGSMWVEASGGGDGRVLRLDPATGAVLAAIDVPATGDGGPNLAVGEGSVWVALTDYEEGGAVRGRLVRIDPATNQITGEIVVGRSAAGVAAGFGAVWVTDGLGTLYRIDPGGLDTQEGNES